MIYFLRLKDLPNFVFSSNKTWCLDKEIDMFFKPDELQALKILGGSNSYSMGSPWVCTDSATDSYADLPLLTNNKKGLYLKVRTVLRRTYGDVLNTYGEYQNGNAYYTGKWAEIKGTDLDITDEKRWVNVQNKFWADCGEKIEICACRISVNGIEIDHTEPLSKVMPKNASTWKMPVYRKEN